MVDAVAEENMQYVVFPWSKQAGLKPMTISRAEGPFFWNGEGKRFLDFASQLVCVNVGHQHPKLVAAVKAQAEKLMFAAPSFSTEIRGRLARMIAEVTPGDLNKSYFTSGGGEANEYAVKIARLVTGRQKIISRYRSYHGATQGSISLTGDWRRSFNEPGVPGITHAFAPYCFRCTFGKEPSSCARECVSSIDEMIEHENPAHIAAIIVEPITGPANGLYVPPDDYLPRLRALCDRYGILLILDEVMTGFGRTGEWFATNHYGVVPDIMTLAKGLTNSALPMGAAVLSTRVAESLDEKILWSGSTNSGHALSCAAGIASIEIYREEGLIENSRRLGKVMMTELSRMKDAHPSVGDVRGKGLFAAIELVRDRKTRTPLVPPKESPYAPGGVMAPIKQALVDSGLYVYLRPNIISLAPPLSITEEQLRDGLERIDRVLSVADDMLEHLAKPEPAVLERQFGMV